MKIFTPPAIVALGLVIATCGAFLVFTMLSEKHGATGDTAMGSVRAESQRGSLNRTDQVVERLHREPGLRTSAATGKTKVSKSQDATPRSTHFRDRVGVLDLPSPLLRAEAYWDCPQLNPGSVPISAERVVRLQGMIDSYNRDLDDARKAIFTLQHKHIVETVEFLDGGARKGSQEAGELSLRSSELRDGFLATYSNGTRPELGERVVLILPGDCAGLNSAYDHAWGVTEAAQQSIAVYIQESW